ncbi:MAG: bifunctional phosphopantothenoylcysteine decarboxylase/phosphopantothenate--cysteine ligase CoaBC [Chloroflexota bacterium]|nr:MAG: bifunctional phosphopantothenoylcysteine decarboxylase/phosphopantothenate--cysteine ligase CoaBC [Chloroflexota bacterium]
MIIPFQNKRIVLGVTGSIAVYKSVELASRLTQAGSLVDVILTHSASEFVTPLTFQSVTGQPAYTDNDLWGSQGHILHIGLAKDAQQMVIAPITANTIAKLAHGLADNLLTVTALAARCPILIAPAMDGGMYAHPATQANLETLKKRDATIIGPAEGHLASGMMGIGRMVEPGELLGHLRYQMSRRGPLRKKKIVVTAGGTFEPIDLVRGMTNRSSGKQGFAIAQAAIDHGADVILIAGKNHLPIPIGAEYYQVNTAEEMLAAVLDAIPHASALVMAAAVADFRPAIAAKEKIKKASGFTTLSLEVTTDILSAVAELKSKSGFPEITVGFAAESQNLLENAKQKLEAKKLDLIIANDISASDAGFEVDTNRVFLLDAGGGKEELPLMGKDEVARFVLERVIGLLGLARSDVF